MQVKSGALTILNAHRDPEVYWNGVRVAISGLRVVSDNGTNKVTISVAEDPVLAEMQAAGIIIKRELV